MLLKHKKLFLVITLGVLCGAILRFFVIDSLVVEGSSMEPGLLQDDRIIGNRIAYKVGKIKRQDVVAINFKDEIVLKRVIGLPGDTVEIVKGQLYLDGKLQEEEYILEDILERDYGGVTVPEGAVFVLGDNRYTSFDSRNADMGFIEKDAIRSKVISRLWPKLRLM